jgi:hypothetical protein
VRKQFHSSIGLALALTALLAAPLLAQDKKGKTVPKINPGGWGDPTGINKTLGLDPVKVKSPEPPPLKCPAGTKLESKKGAFSAESACVKNGKKEGPFARVDTAFTEVGNHKQDRRVGLWRVFHTKEKWVLQENNFDEQGRMHGQQAMGHKSGKVCAMSALQDGSGAYLETDEDCGPRRESRYKNGKLDDWSFFYRDGLLTHAKHHRADKLHGLSFRFSRDKGTKAITEVATTCFRANKMLWQDKGRLLSNKKCPTHPVNLRGVAGFNYSSVQKTLGTVEFVHHGGPAEKAGLQVGDRIVKINGKSISKMQANQVAELLSGPAGTQIKLAVKRGGGTKNLTVQKAEMDMALAILWSMAWQRLTPGKPVPAREYRGFSGKRTFLKMPKPPSNKPINPNFKGAPW